MCFTLLSANTEGESMHSGAEEHGMWGLFSSLRQHVLFVFTLHNIHSMLGYYQTIGLAGIKGNERARSILKSLQRQ